ncbi:MAG: lytic transglycosylase domain-containing protein [Bacteroidales bacterium]|nr:lytic transglycosylase domain-containing protein [Bacteroidales bacterium]
MNKRHISYIAVILGIISILIFTTSAITSDTKETEQKDSSVFVVSRQIYIPESVTLFGERVPLEYFEVRESLERELLVNTFYQSQTTQILKYKHRFFPAIDSILAANDIPADFKYLAVAESGLRINISPKGAAGFWQIIESTAKQYGIKVTNEIDQRYDLEKSTEVACKYFKNAYKKFGNWTMAAASYNLGIGGTAKQAGYQEITSFYDLYTNSETSRYVFRILAFKLILENPEQYGYIGIEPYPTIKQKVIVVDTAISDLSAFARSQGSNYKMLKSLNPWLRDKFLPNPDSTSYKITLIEESERKIK